MGRVMTCTYCGAKGHNKRGCPIRKRDEEFKEFQKSQTYKELNSNTRVFPKSSEIAVGGEYSDDKGLKLSGEGNLLQLVHKGKEPASLNVSCVDDSSPPIKMANPTGVLLESLLQSNHRIEQMLKYLIAKDIKPFESYEIPYTFEQITLMAIGPLRLIATQWLPAHEIPMDKNALIKIIIKRKEFQSMVTHTAGKYNVDIDTANRVVILSSTLGIPLKDAFQWA